MSAGDTTATRTPGRLDDTTVAPTARTPAQPGRARGRVVSWLAAVDPLLVAIFVAGFALTAWYTRQVPQWVVMSDELQYSKLALNIAETLSPVPVIRGEYTGSLSQLYPLLTAPFYGLFDMPGAFRAVHVANAAIMASTAIPAYLLGREVTGDRRASLLVAALSVTVPWMAMGTMVLTEVAAYPAFAWAVLGMQRAIDVPGPGRDALALAGLGLAFLGRTQFLVLAIVFPVAILAHEGGYALTQSSSGRRLAALRDGVRGALARHRELAILYGVGAVAAIPLLIAGVIGRVLGRYETTIHEGALIPDGLFGSMARHLDFIAVGIGVLPFVLATAWVLSSLVRPTGRRGHAFGVLALLTVAAVTFQASSFNLNFALGGPIQDRYLFYIVPLLFVGMAACLLDPRRRWKAVLATGAFFTWMVSLASFEPSGLAFFASPDIVFHNVLDGKAYEVGRKLGFDHLTGTAVIVVASAVLTVAVAVLMRRTSPRTSLAVVGVAVLGFCAVETWYVLDRIAAHVTAGPAAKQLNARDWIDEQLPAGESVGAVPSPVNAQRSGQAAWFGPGTTEAIWLDTEFWNKAVDQAYIYDEFGGYAPFYFSEIELDWATGRLAVRDPERYWVVSASDIRFRPRASLIEASRSGLDLIEPGRPYQALWATRGLGEDGWTRAGRAARIRLYPAGSRPVERRVVVRLQSSGEIKRTRPWTVATANGAVLARGAVRTMGQERAVVRVCTPPGRPTDLVLRIQGGTKLPDRPSVGLRVIDIGMSESAVPCTR